MLRYTEQVDYEIQEKCLFISLTYREECYLELLVHNHILATFSCLSRGSGKDGCK